MKPLTVRYARSPTFLPEPVDRILTPFAMDDLTMLRNEINCDAVGSIAIVSPTLCTGWRILVNREVHFRAGPYYADDTDQGREERQAAQRICPMREHGMDDWRSWVHVVSPLNTVQELVKRDIHYPWRVLVVCMLLNQTHGRQVRPMIEGFFENWPGPTAFLQGDRSGLVELIKPLGLYNRRAAGLVRMTQDYIDGKRWQECYGVGPYALDSIDLYVQGKTDVSPTDTWLQPYLFWRQQGGPRVGWDWSGHKAWREEIRA